MGDDYANLGSFGIENDFFIHCVDEDPNSILKQLEDLSQIEKYVMSDEDYNKLPMNVRKFKKQLKLNNPELFTKKQKIVINPDYQKDLADTIKIGDRCQLVEEQHRGEVAYVGKVSDLGLGFFIGIRLDEPWGNCDGAVNGVKYFEADSKYGLFRRPSEIEVGDFPEEEIDEI